MRMPVAVTSHTPGNVRYEALRDGVINCRKTPIVSALRAIDRPIDVYFGIEPKLPEGRTAAEKRGRRFFIDLPPEGDFKAGLCAGCHSGPMLVAYMKLLKQFAPADATPAGSGA